jgi:hypothetical protein
MNEVLHLDIAYTFINNRHVTAVGQARGPIP